MNDEEDDDDEIRFSFFWSPSDLQLWTYSRFLVGNSFQIYTCQATNGHVVPPKSTYAKLEMRRKFFLLPFFSELELCWSSNADLER